eukprot:Pgem_evm1s9297
MPNVLKVFLNTDKEGKLVMDYIYHFFDHHHHSHEFHQHQEHKKHKSKKEKENKEDNNKKDKKDKNTEPKNQYEVAFHVTPCVMAKDTEII